jgi:opacity protein-like surface antigen
MNAWIKFAALAGTAMFAATTAHAQDAQPTGFYGELNVGVANLNDANITYYDDGGTFGGTGAQDTFDGTFDFKSAATFGGKLGYDFGPVRTDLEITYARNKAKAFTINRVNGQPVTLSASDRADVCDYLEADTCGGSGNTFQFDGSRARQLNALVNLWADLPLGRFVPYAGGGVGIAGYEVDGEGKGKFAWQLGAGAAYHVSPTVAVTADYRHRQNGKTTIEFDNVSGVRLGKLKTDAFTLGLRAYF